MNEVLVFSGLKTLGYPVLLLAFVGVLAIFGMRWLDMHRMKKRNITIYVSHEFQPQGAFLCSALMHKCQNIEYGPMVIDEADADTWQQPMPSFTRKIEYIQDVKNFTIILSDSLAFPAEVREQMKKSLCYLVGPEGVDDFVEALCKNPSDLFYPEDLRRKAPAVFWF